MKICVLSGSPKGKYSITYQTVRFLEMKFPGDTFETVHVGQRIHSLEKDMSLALEAVRRADLLLFCYPVYTFIVPYQLHRFIELLKESGEDISGKYGAQISTSKHFYDTTAHTFVKENCEDMGLRYLGGLSADMDDLLTNKGQKDAVAFWRLIHWRVKNHICESVSRNKDACSSENAAEESGIGHYIPHSTGNGKDKGEHGYKALDSHGKNAKAGRDVVIVADLKDNDPDLGVMIEDFCNLYPYTTRVVNLEKYPFKGGCLGCFNCAVSGKCIYKDHFDEFLRKEIQTASAIVYAFRITDHSMGSRMKLYDDRQFCNGHRTVTAGMPVGYLIRGDLDKEPNLRMIIQGRSEVGGNFLAGTATDEKGVEDLAKSLVYALKTKLTQPATFLGVGGMKIFRDLIWLMQGMMKADHKFYKEHGLYDFPQKQKATILKMKLVGCLISNPKVKAKMGNMMNEGMIAPYRKIVKGKED